MKKYTPTFFEASLKSIIKPNKDSTKTYKPVNRIFITHCMAWWCTVEWVVKSWT